MTSLYLSPSCRWREPGNDPVPVLCILQCLADRSLVVLLSSVQVYRRIYSSLLQEDNWFSTKDYTIFFVVLYKGAPYDGSKGVRSAFLAPSFNYVSGIHKALDIFWAISHLTLSLFIYFPLRFLLFRTSVPNENSYTSLQKMV